MKELVLQERVTLDQALITNMRTYRNGCNWRLVKELNDCYYLEYGCDGVYINLINSSAKMLYKWFITPNEMNMKKLTGIVMLETIGYLLAQKPCTVCGGAKFKADPI